MVVKIVLLLFFVVVWSAGSSSSSRLCSYLAGLSSSRNSLLFTQFPRHANATAASSGGGRGAPCYAAATQSSVGCRARAFGKEAKAVFIAVIGRVDPPFRRTELVATLCRMLAIHHLDEGTWTMIESSKV